jgi:hypothetical protein
LDGTGLNDRRRHIILSLQALKDVELKRLKPRRVTYDDTDSKKKKNYRF